MRTERDRPATFFSRDTASATLPRDTEHSLRLGVCVRTRVRAYNHSNHEPYISSRRASDEDEKKAGWSGKGGKKGKKDLDCESPAGAKDEHAAYCFALSDRSRGPLRQCSAVVPPPPPPLLLSARMMREKLCWPDGQNIFIPAEWRVNAAAHNVSIFSISLPPPLF